MHNWLRYVTSVNKLLISVKLNIGYLSLISRVKTKSHTIFLYKIFEKYITYDFLK